MLKEYINGAKLERYDAIIIGAGLGGLACGSYLSGCGRKVIVLEQSRQIGGALQMFSRGGNRFDCGFHLVGGVRRGETMEPVFSRFGLGNLPWKPIQGPVCDEVWIDGERFCISPGREGFVQSLAESFPAEKNHLETYVDVLEHCCKVVPDGKLDDFCFTTSAVLWMKNLFTDLKLIKVILATCSKADVDDKMPLFVYAHIAYPYIEGSYKLHNGGEVICNTLAKTIQSNGGVIVTEAEVTELVEEEGRMAEAVLADGRRFGADVFVSDIHPQQLLALCKNCPSIGKTFRRRIGRLENSVGMFTVNCVLEPQSQRYIDHSVYIVSGEDKIFVNFPWCEADYALAMDILMPMDWDAVARWENTTVGRRGEDYKKFKTETANRCIAVAETALPGIAHHIREFWTSTPLTYRDYTGTWHGSAFGVKKDCESPLTTFLSSRTPIDNLRLTGQNMAIHGIGGVLHAALQTCKDLYIENTKP